MYYASFEKVNLRNFNCDYVFMRYYLNKCECIIFVSLSISIYHRAFEVVQLDKLVTNSL